MTTSSVIGTLIATPSTANLQVIIGTNPFPTPSGPQICGQSKGLGIGSDTVKNAAGVDSNGINVNTSICSKSKTFEGTSKVIKYYKLCTCP